MTTSGAGFPQRWITGLPMDGPFTSLTTGTGPVVPVVPVVAGPRNVLGPKQAQLQAVVGTEVNLVRDEGHEDFIRNVIRFRLTTFDPVTQRRYAASMAMDAGIVARYPNSEDVERQVREQLAGKLVTRIQSAREAFLVMDEAYTEHFRRQRREEEDYVRRALGMGPVEPVESVEHEEPEEP